MVETLLTFFKAVLIENSTLVIFFGADKKGFLTADLLFLDVRDVNHLSFSEVYPIGNVSIKSTQSSMSQGTIIGISVGTLCVSIFIYQSYPQKNSICYNIGCSSYYSYCLLYST